MNIEDFRTYCLAKKMLQKVSLLTNRLWFLKLPGKCLH